MSTRNAIWILYALCTVSTASADNFIREWGGAQGGYIIDQADRKITITAPGIYKFEATDGDDLGTIDKIVIVEGGFTGQVYLYVARDDEAGGGDGALDVELIDLTGASAGRIKELRIAGDLAADGPVRATSISGPFTVGDDILDDIEVEVLGGDISCHSMRDLTVSARTESSPRPPNITVYTLAWYNHTIDVRHGSLHQVYIWGQLTGEIKVAEDVNLLLLAWVTGNIDIGRDLNGLQLAKLDGTLRVGRDLILDDFYYLLEGGSGELTVERNLSGVLDIIATGFAGPISIHGDMPGRIDIWTSGDLTGTITIGGSLSGSIGISDNLFDSARDLSGGHIIVNGSLTESGYIWVGGSFQGDTEFIAIDYDGWDEADTWESGATITVGEDTYEGNEPDAHVWEITSCKADMNNDELVDFFDIDPFVTAITDPGQYALDYPGLAYSMVFHGDLNCDGYVDFFDIDPFVARAITDPCCYEECGDCPERFGGEGGGESLSPLEMAIELATHIAPERYDTLVEMIALLAAAQKDAEKAAYWTAVWAALSE